MVEGRVLSTTTYASHLLVDHLTSTNFAMTAPGVPQWLQTVNEKRLAREKAIQSYLDTHKNRFEVPAYAPEQTLNRQLTAH